MWQLMAKLGKKKKFTELIQPLCIDLAKSVTDSPIVRRKTCFLPGP